MTITYKRRSWYNILYGWHIAYIWSSINTLIGLAIWAILAGRGKRPYRTVSPGILIRTMRPHSWLGRYFARRSLAAITFGHLVLIITARPPDNIVGHELVHIRQYELLGPLFLPLYGLASLVVLALHKDFYFANPFERQAYKKQAPWASKYVRN